MSCPCYHGVRSSKSAWCEEGPGLCDLLRGTTWDVPGPTKGWSCQTHIRSYSFMGVILNGLRKSDGELLMGHERVKISATGRSVTVIASLLKEGKELGQYLLNERPGVLFFIFNTEATGVLLVHDLWPPRRALKISARIETCKNLIFKLVGQEFSDIDVIDIKPWMMHAEVAEKHASCDNQIILAGDAAPRSPPAGGFDVAESKKSSNSFSWWSICQMTNEGAILVGPDEHIAWRVKSGLDGNPILETRRVFFCNIEEIGCIQNLPCPRQLSWMPGLPNFACFGVSVSGLHNIVLNMNTCHFRRLYLFFLSD
ncbi:hypothetical protein POTOM_037540 [Populus tomentosa]|uniref:FAD-binding domain-containing protein n=1 Tax=Populus tomentosa TaxID=118781 RepID=A0A8X8CK66_POPTO|nr:hypothetical protein POTOM_037540 [Populus tomentosa]